jgi:hypothetical protein
MNTRFMHQRAPERDLQTGKSEPPASACGGRDRVGLESAPGGQGGNHLARRPAEAQAGARGVDRAGKQDRPCHLGAADPGGTFRSGGLMDIAA